MPNNLGILRFMQHIFLDPRHRRVSDNATLYTQLQSKHGINRIIHGHESYDGSYAYGWVEIMSSDHGFGKWSIERWLWDTPNVTEVREDGRIHIPSYSSTQSYRPQTPHGEHQDGKFIL
jgi:hypothetical protein